MFLYFFLNLFLTSALCSSSIYNAIFKNDIAGLQALLDNPEELKQINDAFDECTPLQASANRGYSGCMELLLQAGADPNNISNQQSPLHTCCFNGLTEMVEMLLKRDANPNQVIYESTTPVDYAIFTGNNEIMELLLNYGVNIESPNCKGRSLLMRSIEYGHKECVSFLLTRGASETHRDNNGQTPLMIAVRSSFPVKRLSLSNSSLLAIDTQGNMAADYVINRCPYEPIYPTLIPAARIDNENSEMLSDLMNSISLLDCSTKTEFDSLLRYKGGSRYLRSAEGYELLAKTIKENHPAVLGWILELGFSVDQCFGGGVSLLHYAALHSTECAKILLRNGASITARTTAEHLLSRTPLHYACLSGNEAIVKELLERGALVEDTDSEGKTAIDCAVKSGASNELISLLRDSQSSAWIAVDKKKKKKKN